jgi:hypothetical protein
LEEKLEDIKEEMQVLVWDWYKDVSICCMLAENIFYSSHLNNKNMLQKP